VHNDTSRVLSSGATDDKLLTTRPRLHRTNRVIVGRFASRFSRWRPCCCRSKSSFTSRTPLDYSRFRSFRIFLCVPCCGVFYFVYDRSSVLINCLVRHNKIRNHDRNDCLASIRNTHQTTTAFRRIKVSY